MKKFFKVMLISICSLVAIVGCTQKEVDNSQKVENSDETIKVMEDVYVDYINDFYYDKKLPKKDDWIKVIGKLKNKNNNLIIEAETVEIMNEKGLEKVKSFY